MKLQKRRNKGFTLIEVIAVMAIMSLIATIAIPKVSKYLDRANKTRVVAAVSELNNFVISNEIDQKHTLTDIGSVMTAYGKLDSLKINATTDGNFHSGKVKGTLEYSEGTVSATLSEPTEFANEVIGPKSVR